jgi:S-adenosylhomocysteine hydrolase
MNNTPLAGVIDRAKLVAMGIAINKLTAAQQKFLADWE